MGLHLGNSGDNIVVKTICVSIVGLVCLCLVKDVRVVEGRFLILNNSIAY